MRRPTCPRCGRYVQTPASGVTVHWSTARVECGGDIPAWPLPVIPQGMTTTRSAPTSGPRCGTVAGNSVHVRRGEEPCQPCKDAKTDYAQGVS